MAKIGYEIQQGIAQITMDDGTVNAVDFAFFGEMGGALGCGRLMSSTSWRS
jgi:hypothetical protein